MHSLVRALHVHCCRRDLDEAMPAYYASVDALKSLNKNDVNEVKAYKQPPELVVMTLECICILMGVKPDWGEAKKLMGDSAFLEKLQEYDKDNIAEKKVPAWLGSRTLL